MDDLLMVVGAEGKNHSRISCRSNSRLKGLLDFMTSPESGLTHNTDETQRRQINDGPFIPRISSIIYDAGF
jgi:hypothetical protein